MAKKKIAIIDYGMSNMFSMKNALDKIGFNSLITTDPDVLDNSDGVVLPGVGSFPEAISKLYDLGFDKAITNYISSKRPFLGVCLGFQMLFESSSEFGENAGLGIFQGDVAALAGNIPGKHVPHVGWNLATSESYNKSESLFDPLKGVGESEYFYFIHSYYARPANSNDIYTRTSYGEFQFCSSILKENVFACQFHPEKSGEAGIQVLSNIFSV